MTLADLAPRAWTNSHRFAWMYMTTIGYGGAFIVYQLGSML